MDFDFDLDVSRYPLGQTPFLSHQSRGKNLRLLRFTRNISCEATSPAVSFQKILLRSELDSQFMEWLVGGFNQPPWKIMDFVSWDDYSIPNWMESH